MNPSENQPTGRVVSLDVFRGIIMFLLVAETAGVYHALDAYRGWGTFWEQAVAQLHHHPWHGLRFWDLIQPFFMFIVGVAMSFSVARRQAAGQLWRTRFRHIAVRCALLLAFGVGLHCIYAGELRWELWNVLSQLSVTILIAFLIIEWPWVAQIAVSFALILLTDLAYRTWPIDGYDQPFTQGQNLGSWFDMLLMGKINGDGWVAINCIPTAAHTIWGVVAGQLLQSALPAGRKVGLLLLAGLPLLAVGYGLDMSGIAPIIKRICTSSFVIVSGGWCLVALAALYWLVDVAGQRRWGFVFLVIGMNPIFIYMFSETIGRQWLNDAVAIFTDGALLPLGASEQTMHLVAACAVLTLEWLLCFWLYRRRIAIRV